jgi:hypothetical protein
MLAQYNTFNTSKMADVEANTAPMGGFAVDAKPAPVAATPKQTPPGFKLSVIIWSWIQCTAALPLQCALDEHSMKISASVGRVAALQCFHYCLNYFHLMCCTATLACNALNQRTKPHVAERSLLLVSLLLSDVLHSWTETPCSR